MTGLRVSSGVAVLMCCSRSLQCCIITLTATLASFKPISSQFQAKAETACLCTFRRWMEANQPWGPAPNRPRTFSIGRPEGKSIKVKPQIFAYLNRV